jgi:hypothetical protein
MAIFECPPPHIQKMHFETQYVTNGIFETSIQQNGISKFITPYLANWHFLDPLYKKNSFLKPLYTTKWQCRDHLGTNVLTPI